MDECALDSQGFILEQIPDWKGEQGVAPNLPGPHSTPSQENEASTPKVSIMGPDPPCSAIWDPEVLLSSPVDECVSASASRLQEMSWFNSDLSIGSQLDKFFLSSNLFARALFF